MIKIKMTTTKGQLQEMTAKAVSDFRRKAIAVLQRAGEEAINIARDGNSKSGKDWKDQTGNLRSSIGYLVCENGVPILGGGFQQKLSTATDGPTKGKSYAAELASTTSGLALVVVAGMSYAVYVADKGYDVLSSSQIRAQMRIPELLAGMANNGN